MPRLDLGVRRKHVLINVIPVFKSEGRVGVRDDVLFVFDVRVDL